MYESTPARKALMEAAVSWNCSDLFERKMTYGDAVKIAEIDRVHNLKEEITHTENGGRKEDKKGGNDSEWMIKWEKGRGRMKDKTESVEKFPREVESDGGRRNGWKTWTGKWERNAMSDGEKGKRTVKFNDVKWKSKRGLEKKQGISSNTKGEKEGEIGRGSEKENKRQDKDKHR